MVWEELILKIATVIEKMKAHYHGSPDIKPATTRDQVLFGEIDKACTGIVTTQWPSVEVIKEARRIGANLIITHEALFWNHGDHTDWLDKTQNTTYLAKKQLLEDAGITIWRCHDYVHSGIPLQDGSYRDGIFYGLAKALNWEKYLITTNHSELAVKLPKTTVSEVARHMIDSLDLEGARVLGNLESNVESANVTFHILGDAKQEITDADEQQINVYLTPELIDFTLSEYIRDSSQLGQNRAIIAIGHFNIEEPGMAYMATYIPAALGTDKIPVTFVKSGDMYHYIIRDKK